ncbi:type VI secretion system tube protein Hcp [Roseateles toxinivorans]|uniref:Type VI protein secretion system component Hcp n=1 Tax=Roseateles toxinivorans TaxID=270368 RepID=A0A4R6QJE0_9BURK|nr:type VI secretion system tube protein Hcp [Roseateles toxinivorans]TDP62860.1 type VI protein secretion system component Hcp [Roseateles toxinivorans]
MSATMIFLKLYVDNKLIAGEGTTEDYVGQIEIESFSWGMKAKHTEKGRDKVSVEVRPQEVTLSKYFDKSTTNLCLFAESRKPFTTARLTFLSMVLKTSNQKPKPVMEMVFSDGYVEEVKLNASEAGKSMALKEDVSLSFRKLKVIYHPIEQRRGARGAPTTFDLEQPSVSS